ncbi:uncharacterized protein LOC107040239 isoform X1 [Diachasma alloeum]|uniref:uncharacterized protein LOC107040239 isoform X1 n=1 Tax=Diachasma alloeum TaxID=454923 RepID=UPI0007384794|nr:uncharacterized protein LOC107040239 isoform X1 [Diachasma alloeum]
MENSESLILSNQTAQSLLLVKIGAMFILGLGSLGLGMLPLAVGHCRLKRRQKCALSSTSSTSTNASSTVDTSAQGLLTSLLLCFGGGVLLFTTFLHLAPEVRQSVERHQLNGQLYTIGTLSMAELLFCIGFFLVYLVEETVHVTLTSKSERSEDLLYRTVSIRRCCNKQLPTPVSITTMSSTADKSCSSSWEASVTCRHDDVERRDISGLPELKNHRRRSKNEQTLPVVFVQSSTDPMTDAGREEDRFVAPQSIPACAEPHKVHHHTDTSARGLLTVVALSFHAVFEGLAVGLEPAVTSVVYLTAAIATHKLVIAFCVGMELYVAGAPKKTILGYLSVLSMVTPLGIIIGVALGYFKNNSDDNLGPIPTILQGMAAGTLLYVVFFEVLARERANDKSGLLQLVAIIVGFTLMLGLQLLTSHAHSHSHSHGHSHGHSHEGEESLESEHHHDHGDGEHVHAITDTIDRLSSTVAEAVTKAIMTSKTES